jgi:hypothetical protein
MQIVVRFVACFCSGRNLNSLPSVPANDVRPGEAAEPQKSCFRYGNKHKLSFINADSCLIMIVI